MKVEIKIDKETFIEFDVSDKMLLKVMYHFVDAFESNAEFIDRMSKK